jgi:L-iditol 2-dehydrogenase
MKAMMLTGIRQMAMMDVPDPVLKNPTDVKIRMSVLGICGSDIHYYTQGKIGSQKVNFPFTVGHEGAGVVVETGSGVTRVKPGDKIAIEPAMPCWECDQCKAGRHHTCRKISFLGTPGQAEGCLSEYLVMPEENCFPLPANLIPDHGSISEPLAIGVYSVLMAAKVYGMGSAYITDKIDERLAIASREGVAYTGNPDNDDIVYGIIEKEPLGLDVVFECCGQQEALDQAVDLLKPGGKLIVIGIPEFDRWSLNVENTRRKEIMLLFIRRQVNCVDKAIELMGNGSINITNMVTHRFSFDRTKEAFDLVAGYRDGAMKVMIDF